jgi:hypothetical protein
MDRGYVMKLKLSHGQNNSKTLNVSGSVVDFNTGEPLPHINIQLFNSMIGTSSNEYGQFALLGVPAQEAIIKAD